MKVTLRGSSCAQNGIYRIPSYFFDKSRLPRCVPNAAIFTPKGPKAKTRKVPRVLHSAGIHAMSNSHCYRRLIESYFRFPKRRDVSLNSLVRWHPHELSSHSVRCRQALDPLYVWFSELWLLPNNSGPPVRNRGHHWTGRRLEAPCARNRFHVCSSFPAGTRGNSICRDFQFLGVDWKSKWTQRC